MTTHTRSLVLIAAVLLNGCAHTGSKHTHVIIGFGVVRVTEATNTVGSVTEVKALGVYTGNRSATLGWTKQVRTEVPTNSNVIIDVRTR